MDKPDLKDYNCHRRGCSGELGWDGVAYVCEICGLEVVYSGEVAGEMKKNGRKRAKMLDKS